MPETNIEKQKSKLNTNKFKGKIFNFELLLLLLYHYKCEASLAVMNFSRELGYVYNFIGNIMPRILVMDESQQPRHELSRIRKIRKK